MIYANNRRKGRNKIDLFGKSKNQKLLCLRNGFLAEKPVQKAVYKTRKRISITQYSARHKAGHYRLVK